MSKKSVRPIIWHASQSYEEGTLSVYLIDGKRGVTYQNQRGEVCVPMWNNSVNRIVSDLMTKLVQI